MDAADKRMLEREALRNMIQQWNANRLDLFALSEPNENLEFHGVMRFYFQDSGQKIATKCIRVASDATVSDVIETLIEKFRPDMRMLSLGSYSLWETHGPDDERKLEPHEKPLLVQLNWHADDREGRFLLKCLTGNEIPSSASDKGDQNFKRKLSKREKKELKKKEKLSRLKSDTNDENRPVAEKLYTELPETSFMRSISNPEAVMRRRRQQKLGRKLQQFKSKDGGPDTGGTLRIYGGILRPDVSYITLLLSVNDSAATVLRETLDKYGMGHHDPQQYCIVQEDKSDNTEYILEDDECPLALMNMTRSSIMFHVRRRPADSQPRRRKKKTAGQTGTGGRPGNDPVLVEVTPDAAPLENGRRLRITEAIEVGSGNGTALQLYGPSIQPRHCVVAPADGGGYTVTPLHPDAQVYVNGQRILHTQRLQHGCLLKFGRVSTFRFMDPAQENLINRNLAQSQHYGSGSIYDRSGTSPGETSGAMSPTSVEDGNGNGEEFRNASPDTFRDYHDTTLSPYNNNTLKLDNESLMTHHIDSKDENSVSGYNDHEQNTRTPNSHYKDNYETTFDLDGNVETKSICSAKSGGSGHDNRMSMRSSGGQEAILPAVLEFPEAGQAQFLAAVITCLDPHAPAFKLAPVYTLYLCARYRASTHYRPELTPTERAQKLTNFLHHVAYLIHSTVQERCKHSAAQAFWMANASELLHFLKYDRHISSFSTQAQELLSQTVEAAFSNLVACFQAELSGALETLMSVSAGEPSEATAATLRVLAGAVVLLRLCRVNAALTLQLFSSLFYYINSVCFNKLVTEPGLISPQWGAALTARLALLSAWALRQGSEIAADCQLAKIYQAARLIQRTYRTGNEVVAALSSCSKLNSVQVRALLTPLAPPEAVEAGAAHAARLADELCRADGRGVRLEESGWLCVDLMIPCDGFSAEVVRGVPPGLCEFVGPLQRAGLCRLAAQPRARGDWAVYLARAPPPSAHPPLHIVQLHKNANGMGLSIVAAKGSGQSKLGIYIKSVVPGGAAAADGRLAAGDQLLSVDGQSLVGITQEKAAEYLVRTGPTVTLEVAKQGAMLHGLATLLHQPAYNQQRQGFSRRPCRPRWLPDSSSESSSSGSLGEGCAGGGGYCGSIPRLVVTLDRETDELRDDLSPDTPGCPLELRPHPIPVFTFTCEDDDREPSPTPSPSPPPVPSPPARYETEESESPPAPGPLPPSMRPIEPRLALDPFPPRRCTSRAECASACECCRTPLPDPHPIPYIDAADEEPLIFEGGPVGEGATPPAKTRRILPSLSLDRGEDPLRPATQDAGCQTPSTPPPLDVGCQAPGTLPPQDAECQTQSTPPPPPDPEPPPAPRPAPRRLDLALDVYQEAEKIEDVHSRLRRTLDDISRSFSLKSEDTDFDFTPTATETSNERSATSRSDLAPLEERQPSVEDEIVPRLENVERKSWKSPDEYRPAFGKVRALARRFNDINLRYSVRTYKRNCRSSPNLNAGEERPGATESVRPLGASASLADIPASSAATSGADRLSEHEVKSILIQLEDWSRYGSRGSEDTLAHGNEFEVPNLPAEEAPSLVFPALWERPRALTLDTIVLPSPPHPPPPPRWPSLQLDRPCSGSGARRASERDLPARLAAEPVKPSKSTPALHHAAAPPPAHAHPQHHPHQHHPPPDTHSVASESTDTSALWAQKSRSSHNLAAPQRDAFYQTMATIARDRWGGDYARRHSAHFSPDALHTQQNNQTNAMSVRAAKLAEMSEEVSRREQHAYNMQHRPQHNHIHGPIQAGPPPQQMHQQMQSPIQSPMQQSMQSPIQQMQPTMQSSMPQQMQQSMPQQIQQSMPQQMQQSMPQQMQQSMPQQMQQSMPQQMQQSMPQQMQQSMPQQMQQSMPQQMHQSAQQQLQHNMPSPHLQHSAPQRYEWHQPPSPQRSQPPVAPKPQQSNRRTENEMEDDYYQSQSQQPQPQTSNIEPEEERYVASTMEPPGVVYVGGGGGGGAGRGPASHNPWQREEHERQAEARRQAARARRDAAISHLVSLGASRTPAQNQQLRALQLERDFELRATEQQDQEERGTADGEIEDDEHTTPSPPPAPVAAHPSPLPPKSILKTNTRTEITNGYAQDQSTTLQSSQSELTMSSSTMEVAASVAELRVSGAPPPPARGSSFAVMASRRPLSPLAPLAPLSPLSPHATHQQDRHAPQSPVSMGRGGDKRVSFHERAGAPPAPPSTSPPPLEREDPDRFLEEADAMLASPASPTSPSAPNAAPTHTPGVIGAQEVYRDPRTRRLAEQQARATSSAAIPEQLSFKEKMKMFALESGEASTPKDKVKISRAQRDIDAVH